MSDPCDCVRVSEKENIVSLYSLKNEGTCLRGMRAKPIVGIDDCQVAMTSIQMKFCRLVAM